MNLSIRPGATVYIERIQQYMLKATHEAKSNTSWVSPNEAYENATRDFVAALLEPSPRNSFLADFEPFSRRVSEFGMWNSLSQTLLKLTCPGVPDIYQGTELWDLSLVDPDNRRAVDYETRRQQLDAFQRGDGLGIGIAADRRPGRQPGGWTHQALYPLEDARLAP